MLTAITVPYLCSSLYWFTVNIKIVCKNTVNLCFVSAMKQIILYPGNSMFIVTVLAIFK